MRRAPTMAETIASLATAEELDGFAAELRRHQPIDSATQSLLALRRIELARRAEQTRPRQKDQRR